MRTTSGIYLRFGEGIDAAVSARVLSAAASLAAERPAGITEIVPSYASLYVEYDRLLLSTAAVRRWCARVLTDDGTSPHHEGTVDRPVVEVPVRYDGRDLEAVAVATELDPAEVARRHAAVEYRVYAVGFTPGFPFMGAVDTAIRLPRLTTPRARVEPHTVAIADAQTGIYPLASPGGWRQLGTALEAVYDPHRETPFLLAPGDRVRFVEPAQGGGPRVRGEPAPLDLLPEEPRTPVIEVAEPGLLDLVLDAGRYGAAHYGLARSGPLDARSARLANLLLGNRPDLPLLELNVRGPVLEVLKDVVLAFTGWGTSARLNGAQLSPFSSFAARAGDRLEFPPQALGVRAYLAVAGGFESKRFMGSASVDARGLIGRPLRAGDRLGIEQERSGRPGYSFLPYARWPALPQTGPVARATVPLRVMPGPQASPDALAALTAAPFRVEHADRMGLQLAGPPVPGGGVLSEANPLGAVQVTSGGQPLVLLNDRGTIGGYVKPAVIHPADLPLAGQLRTGDLVRFVRGSG